MKRSSIKNNSTPYRAIKSSYNLISFISLKTNQIFCLLVEGPKLKTNKDSNRLIVVQERQLVILKWMINKFLALELALLFPIRLLLQQLITFIIMPIKFRQSNPFSILFVKNSKTFPKSLEQNFKIFNFFSSSKINRTTIMIEKNMIQPQEF